MGENDQSIEEILEELSKIDPEFVDRLAQMDWDSMMEEVMREAMEAAAKECRCRVARHYRGHGSQYIGTPLKSNAKCLGALTYGGDESHPNIGVYIQDNRVALVWARDDEQYAQATLDEWTVTLQRCHTECTMAAIMQIFSADGEVTREEVGEGSVMFSTNLPEVA
tara:strand:- start:418 stop:915 length:498 start_codon:yes stop_codon:yes gene_type:complete